MDIIIATAIATAAWLRESWPWLLIPAIPATLFGAWWLWWRLPKQQAERLRSTMPDTKARADIEDNFRKTIGQLLGGIAVLLGAGFAYLQFQQQQENFSAQQENARQQLAASLEQSKQQRESAQAVLISNQVSKGFEQLGSKDKDVVVRLGGIYALEGVMNTSEEYHKPVLEALSAFVRENAKKPTDANTPAPTTNPPATDVQAALTVI